MKLGQCYYYYYHYYFDEVYPYSQKLLLETSGTFLFGRWCAFCTSLVMRTLASWVDGRSSWIFPFCGLTLAVRLSRLSFLPPVRVIVFIFWEGKTSCIFPQCLQRDSSLLLVHLFLFVFGLSFFGFLSLLACFSNHGSKMTQKW